MRILSIMDGQYKVAVSLTHGVYFRYITLVDT